MADHVLITGGAGFIGSRLARHLLDAGANVRILDSLHPQVHGADAAVPAWIREHCDFRKADIRDRAAVEDALDGVDAVAHLVSETGTGQSMYAVHRYVDVNVGGTAVLLEALVRRADRVRKLVVSSSRAVYGEGKYRCGRCGDVYPSGRSPQALAEGRWEPVCPACGGSVDAVATDEDSRTNPSSVYGASKMSQELLAAAFGPAFGMHVVILRYQNVYGAGQSLKNPYTGILTHFFSALRRNSPPRVFEDGRESRDFVHVGDVVAATAAALSLPDAGVFNVGSGVRTTILQLAEAMADCLKASVRPVVVGDYRVGDIRHCFADLRRAGDSLGYAPKIGLTQGLNEFLAWAQEQPDDTRPVEDANRELLAHGLLRSGHDV